MRESDESPLAMGFEELVRTHELILAFPNRQGSRTAGSMCPPDMMKAAGGIVRFSIWCTAVEKMKAHGYGMVKSSLFRITCLRKSSAGKCWWL